jgi:hypothetical protein
MLSNLHLTYTEIDNMSIEERNWYIETLIEENKKLEKSRKSK